LIHSPEEGAINGIYIFSLGACAASWCFIPAIFSKAKWSFLERLTLSLTALAVLLVCRPIVISEFLQHVPILKSMRWPFREMVQVQFFFHFFILLRPVTCLPRVRFLTAVSSSAAFTLGMLLYPCTPTFNDMPLDRQIILSGKLEPYWAQVRTFFKPGDKFVILIPRAPTQTDSMYVPFSLIGAYDYPMIARVVCGSAYSQTVPKDQYYVRTVPLLSPWGAYSINARDALLREHPDLKFITVESIEPLKVTLSSRDGPTIDLIPYFPKGIGPW